MRNWRVIVKGPADEAMRVLADLDARAVSVNGYGSLHATITADHGRLDRWFAASHARTPGALLWYHSL